MTAKQSNILSLNRTSRILVRGTNWIGDVVMSLPALASVRKTFPESHITVLAKPWVADLYRSCPDVDEVIIYRDPGIHHGVTGKYRLARGLRQECFDGAIFLQNAFEAALIAWWARVPVRAGYDSDGRRFFLTHAVTRTRAVRRRHQTEYYREMVTNLGCVDAGNTIPLRYDDGNRDVVRRFCRDHHIDEDTVLVGIAPGAAYGPAKRWFPQRFALVAERIRREYGAAVLVFGSAGDAEQADTVCRSTPETLINLAGKTSLYEAYSLIGACDLYISNDSGLMHLAGALNVPLVAIFGSTNHVTTAPVGKYSVIVRKDVPCSPCLKKTCPTDFRCMDLITVDDVYEKARELLERGRTDGKSSFPSGGGV